MGAYQAFIFGTENDLVLPNRLEGCLDIFSFSGTAFILKCSLELPQLAPHHQIWTWRCRAEPNPTGNRSGVGPLFKNSTILPYVSSAADAIALFDIVIVGLHEGEWRQHFFSFVIHRSSLLKWMERCPQLDLTFAENPTTIPWGNWGPPDTRWFNTGDIYHGYITVTAG